MAGPAERILDRVFLLTTSRRRHPAPVGGEAGGEWSVREAGPRWFALWSGDAARLHRLRVLLLPADWLGLTAEQDLALLQAQLGQGTWPGQSGRALREARLALRRALSRGV